MRSPANSTPTRKSVMMASALVMMAQRAARDCNRQHPLGWGCPGPVNQSVTRHARHTRVFYIVRLARARARTCKGRSTCDTRDR
jgi:hypothetical protein